MPRFGDQLPKMDDVFKSHPHPDVLNDLLSSYRLRAIELLQTTIPEKISHIQSLIKAEYDPESDLYHGRAFGPVYSAPRMSQPSKADEGGDTLVMPSDIVTETAANGSGKSIVALHAFESFPVNLEHAKIVQILLRELEEQYLIMADLKVWLQLEVPVIEDGNSFGADVQAHLIAKVGDATKDLHMITNSVRTHHTDRVKLAVDWARNPNMLDYKMAIINNDHFDRLLCRSHMRRMLALYGGLLTKFQRNWPKVINPKGNNEANAMY
ncbi:hypothetical protein IAU60_005069 [Kwoniella sp. DSM 27419]